MNVLYYNYFYNLFSKFICFFKNNRNFAKNYVAKHKLTIFF